MHMPRRHYDLDELLAFMQRDDNPSAADAVEFFGLDVTPRAIQKAVNKYLGSRPTRPARRDSIRDRVVAHMVNANFLDPHVCYGCGRWRAAEPYIRALRQDDSLDSLVFVGGCCRRAGDF